jgi:hypothetical protein
VIRSQCPNGVLDALDIADMRDFLAEVPGASVPMATCDVDDDGLCDIVDATIMSRAQLNLGPGLGEACEQRRYHDARACGRPQGTAARAHRSEGGKAIHNPPRRPSATRWNTVAPGPSGSAID